MGIRRVHQFHILSSGSIHSLLDIRLSYAIDFYVFVGVAVSELVPVSVRGLAKHGMCGFQVPPYFL